MTTLTQGVMGLGLSAFFPKTYFWAALFLAVLPDIDGLLRYAPPLRQYTAGLHSLPFAPLWLLLAGMLYIGDATLGGIAAVAFSLHLFLDFINKDSVPYTVRGQPVQVPFGQPRAVSYIQEILVGLLFLWIFLK
ncbi:MAG: hypothetical protein EXR62_06660 [Chloroflexi bacterium]|nr:hypothetical protein [Chloroflexota bacterium]